MGFVGVLEKQGGVSPPYGLGVAEHEAGQDASDGRFVWSFDFDIGPKDGELIEAN